MSHAWRWLTGFIVMGLIIILLGCSGSSSQEEDDYKGPHSAGRKVFVANKCANCHAIGGAGGSPGGTGGPGGSPRMKGPDLSKVGKDPAHTIEWIMAHVRNPQAHKPSSRMPKFEDKINDQDLRVLAEYLASLK
jgi:cbb3-type cytochrome oxidase cytochrome c subunit